MSSSYDPAVIKALECLGKTYSNDELLDYRFAVAALLDVGLGEIPEVDLVLLAHKQGVARAVAEARGKKLSAREAKRLTQYATKQLFGASDDAALFAVMAWASAFGKQLPATSSPKPATPQNTQSPKAKKKATKRPAAKSAFDWKAFGTKCIDVTGVAALILAAVFGIYVLKLKTTPGEQDTTAQEALQSDRADPVHVEAREASARKVTAPVVPQQNSVRVMGSWERFQRNAREEEKRKERLAAIRKKNNVPTPPEGYEWKWYPNDPRWKYRRSR